MVVFQSSVLRHLLALSSIGLVTSYRPLSRDGNDGNTPLRIGPNNRDDTEDATQPLAELDEGYRLPDTSYPTHYDINLGTEVHKGERMFSGEVAIHLTVSKVTDEIVMHHRFLSLQNATFWDVQTPNDKREMLWNYDAVYEHVKFNDGQQVAVGDYVLSVKYQGRLQPNEDGFYISSYVNDDGVTKYLATTQFESTSARSAFPCYDEPALKATFSLKITHHPSYKALSNMNSTTQYIDENTQTTTFMKTPRMSTYLLAFVVSDFEGRGTAINHVYARPNAINEVDFAVEAGAKILDALSSYLGIDYYKYVPELKQIAIPDFSAGAMENWGLVTYREQNLLFDPAVNTYRTRTSIATVIAHELAHQWFGNLVSPEWWEYIWLNEGFATLYEYHASHLAYPQQQYWELFNPWVIQSAMIPDGLETTRPMTSNAHKPADISSLFDRVAYLKSGAVLNMMHHVFGEENWTASLKSYLQSRELNTANAEHLYAALQAEGSTVLPSGMTVKSMMDSWTTEKGYPVLTVRRSYDTGKVIISQERFIADRKVPSDNVWIIPYNFVRQSQPNFDDITSYSWMTTPAVTVGVTVPENEWVIFNKQQVGYYRVNYDTKNWQLITDTLLTNPNTIHRLNRAQLIDDSYWLARSGRLDYEVFLNLLVYLKEETQYAPWAAANNVLTYYNNKLRGTDAYSDFQRMVQNFIMKLYSQMSVDTVSASETLLEKYLKQTISSWACLVDHSDCRERSKQALQKEISDGTLVHPDVASVVYCYGLRDATDEVFQTIYSRIYPSQNWAYRTMLIDALGCSQNKDHLKSLLQTALASGSGVEINYKEAERQRIVSSIYSASRTGVDALIEFLMEPTSANEFIARLGINMLNSVLTSIGSRTNNAEEMTKLNDLLTALASRITTTTVNAARSAAEANFQWQQSYEGLLSVSVIHEYASNLEEVTTTPAPATTTPSGGSTATTGAPGDSTTAEEGPSTTPTPDGAAQVAIPVTLLIAAIAIALFRGH